MASTWHSGLLIVVLVFGILFAMLYFSSEASPKVVTIIIPEGSALEFRK